MTDEFDYERLLLQMLRWRGVRDPCLKCKGSGVWLWPSTATWRGGMGGAAMTYDVCDSCWGSGDRYRSGVDLRRLRDEEGKRVAERAVGHLLHAAGVSLGSASGAVEALCVELDNLASPPPRKREPLRPAFFQDICRSLARALRNGRAGKTEAGDAQD